MATTQLFPNVEYVGGGVQPPGGSANQGGVCRNSSGAAQTPAAATRTYITGTALSIPKTGLQVGTRARFRFNMTKTAAGTATSTIDVALGTAGTTADAAVLSFTKPAGTAVADEAYCEVEVIVQSIGASGVLVGEFTLGHNLSATGHAQIPFVAVNATSSATDLTRDSLIMGVCLTSGAADAITVTLVDAEMVRL